MALVFPVSPVVGQRYPVNPGSTGVTQWVWDGSTWSVVPSFIRTNDQTAFNAYKWPTADGAANQQLSTDGAGNLVWQPVSSSTPTLKILSLLESFNGVSTAFTFVESGTTTPFSPSPSTNVVVFLGGVPQIPVAAYAIVGNTITFTEAPLSGSTFYSITAVTL
jgi:hypothetical protein